MPFEKCIITEIKEYTTSQNKESFDFAKAGRQRIAIGTDRVDECTYAFTTFVTVLQ